jgi:hypothetical protein
MSLLPLSYYQPSLPRASCVDHIYRYCVRPNSGRVEPGKEVEVTGMCEYNGYTCFKADSLQVLLQAMKQEPPLDAKCKDKFLVQSVAITADKEFTNTASTC